MAVSFPCILTRENLVEVSAKTPYSYTKLEEAMLAAAETAEGRIAVVGSDHKLYSFRPEHAALITARKVDLD